MPSYTYSHSIDDSSDYNDTGFVNAYALNAYRASSNFDERHIINIGYVYDLPFLKGKTLTDKLLGGWQWSGITDIESGTPFSVYNAGGGNIPTDNAGVSNSIATAASYPDLVGNPSAGIPTLPPGNAPLLYNPAAFVAPTGLTFGDAGRNILRNPWRTNFDMALLKHFAVTESKYFEFRAEAFNVFQPQRVFLAGRGCWFCSRQRERQRNHHRELCRLLRRSESIQPAIQAVPEADCFSPIPRTTRASCSWR